MTIYNEDLNPPSNSNFGDSWTGKHKVCPYESVRTLIKCRGEPLCSPENSAIFFYSAGDLAKIRIAVNPPRDGFNLLLTNRDIFAIIII